MKWYIIQVRSNYENKVCQAISEAIENSGLAPKFKTVLAPRQKVLVNGEEKEKLVYPGYIYLEMDLNDETWHIIKDLPNVTSFLGPDNRPMPISEKEVNTMLSIVEAEEPVKASMSLKEGQEVKIINGPFASFNGQITRIDEAKQHVSVNVMVYGRPTPLDLSCDDVELM